MNWLRLHWKLLLRRFRCIDMFCKDCGRTCADFTVSDEAWSQIDGSIKHGHVLCYDCYCTKTGKTFRLVPA